MKKRWWKRMISAFLILFFVILEPGFTDNIPQVQAADKVFTLTQAQNLAINKSSKYKQVLNKIELQNIKYAAAVKSIQMKKKNMSTFRWTPLLSFKFPEKATLADEYEWQYKPLQITCVINELKHQLNDEKMESKEEVSLLYVEIYVCQQKIAFYEERLTAAEETLNKNRIRLAAGEASENDIKTMEQKIETLNTQLALQMRTFETKKKKMKKLTGLDVTTGYTFTDPYVEAQIPRSALTGLENYTLENDQSYYETKLETQLALTSLNLTESLMKNQYGSKMNGINSFITQARNGEEVDTAAFKSAYNQMLKDVDAPWVGKKKILFIKINKEWFKGAISGSRYVEDDPYQLYTEALEYADAVREQEEERKELIASVDDSFETLVTAKNSYETAKSTCETLKQDVKKATEQNRLGEYTYEELSDLQEEYEQQEMDTLDLLAEYTKQLYTYDRLTCGGITSYLEGTDISIAAATGGNSYLAEETEGEVYYYIDYKIEDSVFLFGISVPENYSLNISHFELYVNGQKIGDKTESDKVLEHLALNFDMVEESKVYLYDEDELLAVCEFDSMVNQDVLEVTGGYVPAEQNTVKTVADYSYTTNSVTKTVELSIRKRDTESIAYYQLLDGKGNVVGEKDLISVSDTFTYLSILVGDFSGLQIRFYDASRNELYVGKFMEGTSTIVVEQ
jgi:hypothetical protein